MPTTNQPPDVPPLEESTPDQSIPSGSQQWLMFLLNRITEKLDQIENRVEKIERMTWWVKGGVVVLAVLGAAIWSLVQFVIKHFDIAVTPK